jgi:V/A-type H+-transporting ATPase subunit F
MRMYLISDNQDTLTGMRLGGIRGEIAKDADSLKAALEKVTADPEIGLVLLTERFGREYPAIVSRYKQMKKPLFIDIPDRHGTGRRPDFITAYIADAIGVKL